MSEQAPTIVIVGGVAGGASAATRARRMNEQAKIILLERDDAVSFANCGMPYYIGGEIEERGKLLVAKKSLLEQRFQLDVRTRHEAVRINRDAKQIEVNDLEAGTTYQLPYDKLILSPGASPIRPKMPGLDAKRVYSLRNLDDADHLHEATKNSKRAIVVGGGFIGLEMAEQLHRKGLAVSLVDRSPQVLSPLDHEMAKPLEQELTKRGLELHLGDSLEAILTDPDGNAVGVRLSSGKELLGDLVMLGLGVTANTKLAADAGLELGKSGGIAVNRYTQTNDPDIYAVGDAAEYYYAPLEQWQRVALAGPANRAGRLAGQHAAIGSSEPMGDVQGTAIVRVFDLGAAVTGLTIKQAKRAGKENVRSVTIAANHHAGYFPGAAPVCVKLVFDETTGRVLGGQAVGAKGVDKRIDVIATAIQFKATVRDLTELDLSYAPPYGSAKDPIHMAAFAACNLMDGFDEVLDSDADLSDYQVVDIRTAAEIESAPLTGVERLALIPIDELRDRLDELDPNKPTVVSCAIGVRGHLATRILKQHGFASVANLSGGATLRRRAVPPLEELIKDC